MSYIDFVVKQTRVTTAQFLCICGMCMPIPMKNENQTKTRRKKNAQSEKEREKKINAQYNSPQTMYRMHVCKYVIAELVFHINYMCKTVE